MSSDYYNIVDHLDLIEQLEVAEKAVNMYMILSVSQNNFIILTSHVSK